MDMVLNHAKISCPFVQLYFDGSNPTTENPWFNVTSNFVANPDAADNILADRFTEVHDMKVTAHIIDTLIDRAAVLVAANLAAVVLKTGKGTSPERPVLITIEGTTFYKLHNFRIRFEKYFSDFLSGERKRYIEFTEVEQSSLIGAALAGLID